MVIVLVAETIFGIASIADLHVRCTPVAQESIVDMEGHLTDACQLGVSRAYELELISSNESNKGDHRKSVEQTQLPSSGWSCRIAEASLAKSDHAWSHESKRYTFLENESFGDTCWIRFREPVLVSDLPSLRNDFRRIGRGSLLSAK